MTKIQGQLRGGKVYLVAVWLSRTSWRESQAEVARKQRGKEGTGQGPGHTPREPTPGDLLPSARPHLRMFTDTPQTTPAAGSQARNT